MLCVSIQVATVATAGSDHLQEIYRREIQLRVSSIISEGDDVLSGVVACVVQGSDVLDLAPEDLVLGVGDAKVLIGHYHIARLIAKHQCSAVS